MFFKWHQKNLSFCDSIHKTKYLNVYVTVKLMLIISEISHFDKIILFIVKCNCCKK